MNDDLMPSLLATWAARDLPARLDAAKTAKLLGFAEHDIQILMALGKLNPLGDPAPNAPKWFSALEMIELAADRDWLHKATKEISKYWRHKRERRSVSQPAPRPGKIRFQGEKTSPDSSPNASPNVDFGDNKRALHSDESVVAKSA